MQGHGRGVIKLTVAARRRGTVLVLEKTLQIHFQERIGSEDLTVPFKK